MRYLKFAVFTISAAMFVASCTQAPPPTVTPQSADAGGTVQEVQVQPGPGGTEVVPLVDVPPVTIDQTTTYRDKDDAFSIDLPVGWPENRQEIDPASGDVKLGTFFQPVARNALISITQFDKGQRPESIGMAINQVLELSGVFEQPNFLEIDREKVYEREGDAMRVEMSYTRKDGVNMHSLVLFQVDGTLFSMVHAGVEQDSWLENEGAIRDILGTYRVPAVPAE